MTQIFNPAVEDWERALKPALVRWTTPGWYAAGQVNQVIVAGTIYYLPIFIPERTLYDRIGINVGVGDGLGGLADLRIFTWRDGLPDILILSAGTVSTNGAGQQSIVIAEILDRGYYFLAVRGDQAPTLRSMNLDAAVRPPVPGLQIDQVNPLDLCVLSVAGVYADPALAPTAALGVAYAFVRLREA